jgi:hypothetical protein
MSNSYNNTENNNTDDTIIYVPKKVMNKIIVESKAREKASQEKLNIIQEALNKKIEEINKMKNVNDKMKNKKFINFDEEYNITGFLKEIDNNNNNTYTIPPSQPCQPVKLSDNILNVGLDVEIGKYSKIKESKQSEEKKDIDSSMSSIFKKKSVNFTGGKQNEQNKKNTSKSNNTSDDTTSDDETSNTDDTDETTSNESSSSDVYTTDYATVNTDDGYNKAYSKINKEMEILNKQSGGMKRKEVINKFNFLFNAMKFLDKSKKRRK